MVSENNDAELLDVDKKMPNSGFADLEKQTILNNS